MIESKFTVIYVSKSVFFCSLQCIVNGYVSISAAASCCAYWGVEELAGGGSVVVAIDISDM